MLTNTRVFFCCWRYSVQKKRLRDNWMTCNFQAFKSNMWSFSARLVPRPKKLCTVWNLRNLFLNFPNLHTQVKKPAIVKGGWLKFFTEVVNFQIGRLVLMACDKLKNIDSFCVCWCSHLTWKMLDGQKISRSKQKMCMIFGAKQTPGRSSPFPCIYIQNWDEVYLFRSEGDF